MGDPKSKVPWGSGVPGLGWTSSVRVTCGEQGMFLFCVVEALVGFAHPLWKTYKHL